MMRRFWNVTTTNVVCFLLVALSACSTPANPSKTIDPHQVQLKGKWVNGNAIFEFAGGESGGLFTYSDPTTQVSGWYSFKQKGGTDSDRFDITEISYSMSSTNKTQWKHDDKWEIVGISDAAFTIKHADGALSTFIRIG
jgi:hypothetical protein